MKSKEQQLLEQAYNEVSFFKDPEPPKDERQGALSFILNLSDDLNSVGSKLSEAYRKLKLNKHVDEEIKNMLAKEGEKLVAASSEIEDIYHKYLSEK